MFEALSDRVNGDPWLVHRGRHIDTQFMIEVGETQYLVRIHGGRVESVTPGPFVMPRWHFALRASAAAWQAFLEPRPRPGFHDLMAMIKFRTLRLEGDQHPFMANLRYFKEVLEASRTRPS